MHRVGTIEMLHDKTIKQSIDVIHTDCESWTKLFLQIWSSSYLPNEAEIKDLKLREYQRKYKKNLLMDYARKEIAKQVSRTFQV